MLPFNMSLLRSQENDFSDTDDNEDSPAEIIFKSLLKDPKQRQIIAQMLVQSKENMQSAIKTQLNNVNSSPIKKQMKCESPSALHRQRQLEKLNNPTKVSTAELKRKKVIEICTKSPPIPFNKLLEDVIAFVEMRTKDGDKSNGAKALMKAMGATIVDKINKNVTHIIYKDGSYTTFCKAKLLKVPLTSVLWLDAMRNAKCRLPAKNYPALCNYDADLSALCEDMNEEFVESIHDEYNKNKQTSCDMLPRVSSRQIQDIMTDDDTGSSSSSSVHLIPPSIDMQENIDKFQFVTIRNTINLPKSLEDSPKIRGKNKNTMSGMELANKSKQFELHSSTELAKSINKEPANIFANCLPSGDFNSSEIASDSKNIENSLKTTTISNKSVDSSVPSLKLSKSSLELSTDSTNIGNSYNESRKFITRTVNISSVTSLPNTSLDTSEVPSMRISNSSNDLSIDENSASTGFKKPQISKELKRNSTKNSSSDNSCKSIETADNTSKQYKEYNTSACSSSKSFSPIKESVISEIMESLESTGSSNSSSSSPEIGASCLSKSSQKTNLRKLYNAKYPNYDDLIEMNSQPETNDKELIPNISGKPPALVTRGEMAVNLSNFIKSKKLKLLRPNKKMKNMQDINFSPISLTAKINSSQTLSGTLLQKQLEGNTTNLEEVSLCVSKGLKLKDSNKREKEGACENNISSNSDSEKETFIKRGKSKNAEIVKSKNLKSPIIISKEKLDNKLDILKIISDKRSSTRLSTIVKKVVQKHLTSSERKKSKSEEQEIETKVVNVDKIKRTDSNQNSTITKGMETVSSPERKVTKLETKNIENASEGNSEIHKSTEKKKRGRPSGRVKKNVKTNLRLSERIRVKSNETKEQMKETKKFENSIKTGSKKNDLISSPVALKNVQIPIERIILSPEKITNSNSVNLQTENLTTRNTININKDHKKDYGKVDASTNLRSPSLRKRHKSDKNSNGNLEIEVLPENKVIQNNKNILKNSEIPLKRRLRSSEKITTINEVAVSPIRKRRFENTSDSSQSDYNCLKEDCKTVKTGSSLKSRRSSESATSTIPAMREVFNRRSTLEFAIKKPKSNEIEKRKKRCAKGGIVCSKLERSEVIEFENSIKRLGKFFYENKVTKDTTHLVTNTGPFRTINQLKAIARGCWILKKEWFDKSVKAGKWLDEEKYEYVEFCPAVEKCRTQRHVYGTSFCMNIFKNSGGIYISENCTPPKRDLEELVTLCGGKIFNYPSFRVSIVVGEKLNLPNVTYIKELWILDSIVAYEKKPLKKYLIK